MRKILAALILVVMLLAALPALAEDGIPLTLKVTFEENMIFSRYDVDVYVNDEKVGVIPHGDAFAETVYVPAGPCSITFYEVKNHDVQGVAYVDVTSATSFECTIHAKNNKVVVDKIKTDGGEVDARVPVGKTVKVGDVTITLTKFRIDKKGSSYNRPESGNVFVLCEFDIANGSDDELVVSSMLSFEGYCDEYKLDYSFGAVLQAKNQLDDTVAPGRKVKGEMGFEVPKDWKELEITYSPEAIFSDKVTFVVHNK